MSRKLKPLLLPQLVEERRKRESVNISDSETDLSSPSSFYSITQTPSSPSSSCSFYASDISTPLMPTYSPTQAHLRHPSSSSSVDVPLNVIATESSSGQWLLPDVQEEPHDRGLFVSPADKDSKYLYDCLCDDQQCMHRNPTMAQSSLHLSSKMSFDYDLNDGFLSDGEYSLSPKSKKRRPGESPLVGLTTRIGTRFPTFSRRWRLKVLPVSTVTSETMPENIMVAVTSSRSSSISNSARQAAEQLPPQMSSTPTKGPDVRETILSTVNRLNVEQANRCVDERDEMTASTPLLPPLTMDASANTMQVSMQSPLQSPSVAESNDQFSRSISPMDMITTPPLTGRIPSPALSTKPSIASFTMSRPGHLTPSSEIPPITIADPNDEWANKLGHANFHILPEPYLPDVFDIQACRQLRTQWDLARCNYTKHLVRTGEHYGVTSKTYALTEAKWHSIDQEWRHNNEITIAKTAQSGSDAFKGLRYTQVGQGNIMAKIPSLNDPRSGNKFPQLGDEDIVGPMVQVAAQLQRSPSKKTRVLKFLAEKFPFPS